MQTNTGMEPRWKTYVRNSLFIAPALFFWWVMGIFVFPKIEQIWQHAGLGGKGERWLLNWITVGVHQGSIIIGLILAAFIAFEIFFSKRWGHYRKAAVGTAVFLLNGTIIFGLTLACMALVMAAPALMHLNK
jgi:hypothetical protein